MGARPLQLDDNWQSLVRDTKKIDGTPSVVVLRVPQRDHVCPVPSATPGLDAAATEMDVAVS